MPLSFLICFLLVGTKRTMSNVFLQRLMRGRVCDIKVVILAFVFIVALVLVYAVH